jgi:hypothetical protein
VETIAYSLEKRKIKLLTLSSLKGITEEHEEPSLAGSTRA